MDKRENGREKDGVTKKIADVLLPFLLYFLVHDLASVLLAFLFRLSLGIFGEGYGKFMEAHGGSVDGVRNGLALCIGALAVWPMAKRELQGEGNPALEKGLQGEGNPALEKGLQGKGNPALEKGLQGKGNPAAERRLRQGKRKRTREKVLAYLALAVCAVSMAIGMNLLLALTGLTEVSENYREISGRQYGVAFGLGLLLYGAVSPAAEEIVFRGLVYRRMRRHWGTGVSAVLCGMLFGIYHGNLVQGIYGCVLGTGIALMYEWYGNIFAPILFHGAANAGVFAVSYKEGAFRGMASPFYCMVLLGISLACFILTGRRKGGLRHVLPEAIFGQAGGK